MALQEVKKVIDDFKGREFDRIFFVSCGGSQALMMPSKFFVDSVAKKVSAQNYNSQEFINLNPASLGKNSVVILCSQEGKTPETVQAALFAKDKGASVLTIAMIDNTPLEKAGPHFVKYGHYETADAIDTSYGIMYLLTSGLIDTQEGTKYFEKMVKNLMNIQAVIAEAKKSAEQAAIDFAEESKDVDIIYSLSAGPDYSQSYVMCNCYLMEMQWINAIPIHAGEFFHGPFEIIEKDSTVILLMGKGETRYQEERAKKFCEKYTEKLYVIDADEYDFSQIDDDFEGFIAPLILNNLCRLYIKKLSIARDHSLDIRRYMHIVEY